MCDPNLTPLQVLLATPLKSFRQGPYADGNITPEGQWLLPLTAPLCDWDGTCECEDRNCFEVRLTEEWADDAGRDFWD